MRASISVVMALIITVLFSFPLVLIESTREQTMLLQSYVALDNSTQSTLAEYQKHIWEEYDILVMDGRNFEGKCVEAGLTEKLKKYAEYNVGADLVNGFILRDDWLHVKVEDASVNTVRYLTDGQGYYCYQEIVDAQKRRYGLNYFEELVSWGREAQEIQLHASDVADEKSEVEQSFQQYFNAVQKQKQEYEEKREEQERDHPLAELEEVEPEIEPLENPLAKTKNINVSFVLKYALGEKYDIKNLGSIGSQALYSKRNTVYNEGSEGEANKEYTMIDQVLFMQYLLEHMKFYGSESVSQLYELEYVLFGQDSNYGNLQGVINQVLVLREIDNYLCLLNDRITVEQVRAISTALASLAQVPYMEPILTQAILLGWAYLESMDDIKQLLDGGKVPLLKSVEYISSSVDDVFVGKSTSSSIRSQEGLSYKDYLMILCYLKGAEQLLPRTLDIMEFNTRRMTSDENFYIDECLIAYHANIRFKDVYGKTYTVDKAVTYY